jgi:L-2-amino-thiazoline-4-carboxylic acid hydrolase
MTEASTPSTAPMPMIERRRIEANILKHVYATLETSHGKDVAQKAVGDAVRSASIQQGQEFSAKVNGNTSIATFADLQPLWTMEDALEITVLKQDDTVMDFNVTRCRYAEMYKDMGLGEIGHLLSCQRDGTFCEGYDKRLKLTRTQTIMGGASHCDFRYRLEDGKAE